MDTKNTFVSRLLRLLPARVLASLDAWSYRVAQQRAQMRREAALARMNVGKIAQ